MATTRQRSADLERWERETFGAAPQRDAPFSTMSGEPIKPLYTERNLPPDADASIGLPGEYPFTRGVYGSMYRGRLWTMRQFAGFGTAAAATEALHAIRFGTDPLTKGELQTLSDVLRQFRLSADER